MVTIPDPITVLILCHKRLGVIFMHRGMPSVMIHKDFGWQRE